MNRNKRAGEYVAFTNEIMGKIPFNHVLGIRVELIKAYSSVAISSAKIANGTACDVYLGGDFKWGSQGWALFRRELLARNQTCKFHTKQYYYSFVQPQCVALSECGS